MNSISSGRKPVFANFRDKRSSWGDFSLTCRFDNGTEYSVEAGQDAYMQGYFANMTLRESCYTCQFKSVSRLADITLADYWGVEKYTPEMLDSNGTSAVMVHTLKGQQLFSKIKGQMRSEEVSLDSILAYNKPMVQSVVPHPRKEQFCKQAIEQEFNFYENLIAQLLKPTLSEKIKYGTKILFDNFFTGESSWNYLYGQIKFFLATCGVTSVCAFMCKFITGSIMNILLMRVVICIVVPNLLFGVLYCRNKHFLNSKQFVASMFGKTE